MNGKFATVLFACALGLPAAAMAQDSADFGMYEYYAKCASCHGISGKGDGPVAKHLTKAPSDLTTYAKRNCGAFPTQLAWQVIAPVGKAHHLQNLLDPFLVSILAAEEQRQLDIL